MSSRITRVAMTVAAASCGAVLVGVTGAPTANASVHADFDWGKSSWYSQSEVKKMAPEFRLMADATTTAGGVGFGAACGVLGIPVPIVGVACAAIVGGGYAYAQQQASEFDYAADTDKCVEIVEPNFGLYDVKPYDCDWK